MLDRRPWGRPGAPGLAGEGDVRGDECAAVRWAVDLEPAVEGCEPVRQPDEAAALGAGAAAAAVRRPEPEGGGADPAPAPWHLLPARASRRWSAPRRRRSTPWPRPEQGAGPRARRPRPVCARA